MTKEKFIKQLTYRSLYFSQSKAEKLYDALVKAYNQFNLPFPDENIMLLDLDLFAHYYEYIAYFKTSNESVDVYHNSRFGLYTIYIEDKRTKTVYSSTFL